MTPSEAIAVLRDAIRDTALETDMKKRWDIADHALAATESVRDAELDRLRRDLDDARKTNDMLLSVIGIVRNYPDFDNGGPLADMMDEALAGKRPTLLDARDALAQGRIPPSSAPPHSPQPGGSITTVEAGEMGDSTAAANADEQSAGDGFTIWVLSELSRRGASPAALSLAVQLFGVGPCPECGFRKLHCRCPVDSHIAPAAQEPQLTIPRTKP
jgi:hypothetical protein